MTDKEKEILEATKYFAESNDLPYDTYIESMISNAIREATILLNQQNDEQLEALNVAEYEMLQGESSSALRIIQKAIQKSEEK